MTTSPERAVRFDTAAPPDRDAIAALFAADMADLGQDYGGDDLRRAAAGMIEDERCHVHIARAGDEVVGVLVANEVWSIKYPGRALWIEELYVRPSHRRGGIGRQLVAHLVVWANEHRYSALEIEAYRMNTAASVLYASLGFRRKARERYTFDMRDYDWEAEEA